MALGLIYEYLRHVRLVSDKEHLKEYGDDFVVKLSTGIGHISNIRVILSAHPITEFRTKEDSTCLLYVFPSTAHVRATLKTCKHSVLSLLYKDILVVSEESVLSSMMHKEMCSYTYIGKSGNRDIDKIAVVDRCSTTQYMSAPYDCVPVALGSSDCLVYSHTSGDLLASFGAEYPLVVYVPLLSLSIDPLSSLYVAVHDGTISVVDLSSDI